LFQNRVTGDQSVTHIGRTTMKSEKDRNCEPSASISVTFEWTSGKLPEIGQLLQHGFKLRARLGTSIRDILCHQFGVSPTYLDQRVNTIFLDGKPVDDVDSSTIQEGSVLALSAAMPGFVGAALRKGGYYSAMRREISHVEEIQSRSDLEGFFTLKLYNMVAKELGPIFLQSGIWVLWEDLKDLFSTRSRSIWSGCVRIQEDGREINLNDFLDQPKGLEKRALVRLTVKSEG